MEIDSLRPQLQFELLKLVLLRENYVKRLRKKLSGKGATAGGNGLDLGVVGLLDCIREVNVQVIETTRLWERAQLVQAYNSSAKPFQWNGTNYLEKLGHDLEFLEEYPQLVDWLGFSTINNPFIVPPEIFRDHVYIPPNSFVVFGLRPASIPVTSKATRTARSHTRSPYLTPIVNDPDLMPQLSAKNRLKGKFQHRGGAGVGEDPVATAPNYTRYDVLDNSHHLSIHGLITSVGLQPTYIYIHTLYICLAVDNNPRQMTSFMTSSAHQIGRPRHLHCHWSTHAYEPQTGLRPLRDLPQQRLHPAASDLSHPAQSESALTVPAPIPAAAAATGTGTVVESRSSCCWVLLLSGGGPYEVYWGAEGRVGAAPP